MSGVTMQAFPVAMVPFASSYSIDMLNGDDDDAGLWSLEVEYRGPGDRWAVLRWGRALGVNGTWDYEPSPSNRSDEWKDNYRFPLEEAIPLALEALPKIKVNGKTWEQYQDEKVQV